MPRPENTAKGLAIFKRRSESIGFSWAGVDAKLFRAAMQGALLNNVAVMFSAASGGRGVCVRLMKGKDDREVDYAQDAEDLNVLLHSMAVGFQTGSEDLIEVMAAD
jgi:hypothetical protein